MFIFIFIIVDFILLFKARFPSLLSTCQLRFQIWKLGGNFASFQSSNFDCKHLFIVGVEITVQGPMHILLH
jgi:hypothetical protein